MAPRFDKSRDFGTIVPPFDGATYEQDHCYFAADGTFLFSLGDINASVDQSAGEQPPADKPTNENEGDGEPSGQPPVPPAPPQDGGPTIGQQTDTQPQSVDLVAWAKKEAQYPFYAIKKAVKDILPDADVASTATVIAALLAASIIAPDEALR